jgi:hypothetical protein
MPGKKWSRGYQRHGGGVWDIRKHVTPRHKQRRLGKKGNTEGGGWSGMGNTIQVRRPGSTGGVSGEPTQVQPALDNWYGVQVNWRRRLKR